MTIDNISFWSLNLDSNPCEICHFYFSVLIIGICQNTNSFVSVSLPLCTQTKWAPIAIICFRKVISTHSTELKLEASWCKWQLLKDRSGKAFHWADLRKTIAKRISYDTVEFLQNPGSWHKMFYFHELWTTEIINKKLHTQFLSIFLLHHMCNVVNAVELTKLHLAKLLLTSI